MTTRKLVLPRVTDPDTQLALDGIEKLWNFDNIPLLDGNLLEDKDVATTETPVAHGLGRVPRGYLIVKHDQSSSFHVYESSTADKNYFYFTGSTAVTLSLWVF